MRAAAALLLLLVLTASCGGPERTRLRVFAASSLTDAFGELEGRFEDAHPDVDVVLAFAGSQVLRLQIEQGAPADVFASADLDHVQALADGGLVAEQRLFATNELVVIVPADRSSAVRSFEDLPEAERLVIGTAEVPVGRYTRRTLARAGDEFRRAVLARVVSEESNVRLVRAKVALGEADAAIVFRTDAVSSDRVRALSVPAGLGATADYPLVILAAARRPELARSWSAFVTSTEGREVLRRHGFGVPR